MTKEEIFTLIQTSIKNDRLGVLKALKDSYVAVNPLISDKELFLVIEREFIRGNGFLVYHLGKVMKQQVESTDGEKKSNWIQAVAAILPALGGLFGGGKKDDGGAAAAAAAQQNQQQMMIQFQMAQQQAAAEAQARKEEQRREDEASRRRSNMMIFGGIGGVVVIGLVIFLVVRKK